MSTTFKISGLLVAILATVLLILTYRAEQSDAQGFSGGAAASDCEVSTITAATVGHQVSSVVLAAHSRRAWARIEQPLNATNTVAVSFDDGAAATINSGLMLPNATTTNALPFIDFGLNTHLPYTGEVEAISSTGSSTLRVTECRY